MTDLPDAETAFEKWFGPNHRFGSDYAREAFKAGFAAASGPWAEQLDAANAETEFWKANDNKRSAKVRKMRAERDAAIARAEKMESFEDALALPQLLAETAAERDAALARNAELEAERDAFARQLGEWPDATVDRAEAERDAARAELDSLRDRVEAQATRLQKVWDDSATGWQLPRDVVGTVNVVLSDLRAAIVRGSDDE